MSYVDVVFAHRYDAATPMEEVVRGFNYLIETGKTFYWGQSTPLELCDELLELTVDERL